MVCFLTPSLLDHILPASYAFYAFLHAMIMVYCYVSGDSCSYDSRASQFLELGVSELCSTVPNSHVKSRVCLGFCYGIAKGGDCKVEFNQLSCWLYSVSNLLVFQQLVTLYLGGILVRVVSEIV